MSGLTGRSSAVYALVGDGRLIGPFDGPTPAKSALSRIRKLVPGVQLQVVRMWDEQDALKWARSWADPRDDPTRAEVCNPGEWVEFE